MATCPNKNTEAWKLLVTSRGEDIAYYLWDKYSGNVPESESNKAIIKSGLKAINILQSLKADQFFSTVLKNKIAGDFFWKKMQVDLAIPKEQIEILRSFNTQDRGELISSLLTNYSYTVEINTAKEKGLNYSDPENYDTIYGASPEEREEQSKIIYNTQHYSNLTVPGGTNYTENEIVTPAITPSIKGHAQFATPQGLMWTRTDEKVQYTEQDIDKLLTIMENSKVLQIKCS